MKYPVTPDGRYFIVRGRLCRCADPTLNESERQRLVKQLMAARSAVEAALSSGDAASLATARSEVHAAKVALGERGPLVVRWGAGLQSPACAKHPLCRGTLIPSPTA